MGDIGEDDPESIDLADCAALLGQPRLLLSSRSEVSTFVSPAGTRNGNPILHEDDVHRWAANTIQVRAKRPVAAGDKGVSVVPAQGC